MQNLRETSGAQAYEVASAVAAGSGGRSSAVSWGAIIAGAVAAIAVTLILLSVGTGVGISSVSPWPSAGASAATVGVMTGIWLIIVQWIAAGIGGYLTGRLRTRWVGVHTHEVFFRDTAHGFLAWSLATLVATAFLASAVSSAVSGASHAATTLAAGAAQGATQAAGQQASSVADPTAYLVDALLRPDNPEANDQGQDQHAEVTRILVTDVGSGQLPPPDRTYLAKLVAARAGLNQSDAEQRVDAVFTQMKDAAARARQAADTARKAAASASILLALSLVVGAFIASVAAAYGGHLREQI